MIITNDDLKDTDYHIIKTFLKVNLSFSEVLNDMLNNEYSRLENYYKDKFCFIKFKDEEVIVEDKKGAIFTIFGRNNEGVFVINQREEIWLLPFANSIYDKPLFINTTLHQFRCCYCLLLSVFFYYNTKIVSKKASKKIAKKFSKDIAEIDNSALNSLFYQNYIYSIENSELPIHFHPIDYVKNKRHTVSV